MFINKVEILTEINSRFECLFAEICDALEPDKEDKSNSLISTINELILGKAMELLSGNTIKIEEVCKCIGFPNEKYFYLFFKKHVGITPNEYRTRKPETRL